MRIGETKGRKLGGIGQPAQWTKNFLATHSFLGFYDNNERVPYWLKMWPSRSKYTPHQGQKECARRLNHGI